MEDIIRLITSYWFKKPGANYHQLQQLNDSLPYQLPEAYKTFLTWSNVGEGHIGSSYLSLWNAEEIVRFNKDYQVNFYLPKVIGIGSDGGGECYALDYRTTLNTPALILVPFGDLEESAIVIIGSSFQEGLNSLLMTTS